MGGCVNTAQVSLWGDSATTSLWVPEWKSVNHSAIMEWYKVAQTNSNHCTVYIWAIQSHEQDRVSGTVIKLFWLLLKGI